MSRKGHPEVDRFWKEVAEQWDPEGYLEREYQRLRAMAGSDQEGLRYIIGMCADRIGKGEPVPEPFRRWFSEALSEIAAKKDPRKDPKKALGLAVGRGKTRRPAKVVGYTLDWIAVLMARYGLSRHAAVNLLGEFARFEDPAIPIRVDLLPRQTVRGEEWDNREDAITQLLKEHASELERCTDFIRWEIETRGYSIHDPSPAEDAAIRKRISEEKDYQG